MSIAHQIQAFSVPKHGHRDRENEDAVAFDAHDGWLAVAVSESSSEMAAQVAEHAREIKLR